MQSSLKWENSKKGKVTLDEGWKFLTSKLFLKNLFLKILVNFKTWNKFQYFFFFKFLIKNKYLKIFHPEFHSLRVIVLLRMGKIHVACTLVQLSNLCWGGIRKWVAISIINLRSQVQGLPYHTSMRNSLGTAKYLTLVNATFFLIIQMFFYSSSFSIF